MITPYNVLLIAAVAFYILSTYWIVSAIVSWLIENWRRFR